MIKKYALIAMAALIGLLVLAGCGLSGIKGSGVIVKEERTVTEFTRVAASGISSVTFLHGSEVSVTVEADNNLLELLETRVENGVLHLGAKNGTLIIEGTVNYTVTSPMVDEIVLSGSATGEALAVNQEKLSVILSGSATIALAGEVNTFTLVQSGSSTLNAFLLTAQQVNATMSASTSAQLTAETALSATLSGSASLVHRGGGVVEQVVTGSATVQKAQ